MTVRDGIFQVAAVDWRLAPFDWTFPRDSADRIAAHWAARVRRAPGIYDGRVLLMRDLAVAGDRLTGLCFEASYKSFLGWRDGGGSADAIFNGFGMAALRSADGAFMLGAMNAGTASAGKLYFPAGTPEPADLDASGRVDLAGNVLRELEEETGLGPGDVEGAPGWTVVVAGTRIACMKLLQSRESAAALRARLAAFNSGQPEPELVDLVPIFGPADYESERMPDFMITYLNWAFAGG